MNELDDNDLEMGLEGFKFAQRERRERRATDGVVAACTHYRESVPPNLEDDLLAVAPRFAKALEGIRESATSQEETELRASRLLQKMDRQARDRYAGKSRTKRTVNPETMPLDDLARLIDGG